MDKTLLDTLALKKMRSEVLEISYNTRSGHIGSAFSSMEILYCLHNGFLKREPFETRDRFILSKGHAAAALYVSLHHAGLIDDLTLKGFAINGGTLRHHPDKNEEWGIEVTSGSLGHGLSLAAGMAYSAKKKGECQRSVVLMSDGELGEGMVWEAALFAAHQKLDALVGIVDCNKIQALGHTSEILALENLVVKWDAFGWSVRRIDGHDISLIEQTLQAVPFEVGKPSLIIADTVKGKGVSFMEDQLLWHYRCPDEDEYQRAMKEIWDNANDNY